jgi:hypothetical protein
MVKGIKIWLSSLDSLENLLSHPVECLIFLLITVIVNLGVLDFSWISTSVQELLEALFKSFLPQELLIIILGNKVSSGILNLLNVVCNSLHGTEKLELIFDFNQVITGVGIKTSHLNGDGNEIINNLLKNILDTCLS